MENNMADLIRNAARLKYMAKCGKTEFRPRGHGLKVPPVPKGKVSPAKAGFDHFRYSNPVLKHGAISHARLRRGKDRDETGG